MLIWGIINSSWLVFFLLGLLVKIYRYWIPRSSPVWLAASYDEPPGVPTPNASDFLARAVVGDSRPSSVIWIFLTFGDFILMCLSWYKFETGYSGAFLPLKDEDPIKCKSSLLLLLFLLLLVLNFPRPPLRGVILWELTPFWSFIRPCFPVTYTFKLNGLFMSPNDPLPLPLPFAWNGDSIL